MPSVSYDFSGRVALVTGGASGVGTAVGGLLAASGAKVALLDLDQSKVDAAAASIAADALALQADVRRSREVNAAVAAVVARHGRLDVLVNAAGVAGRSLKTSTSTTPSGTS